MYQAWANLAVMPWCCTIVILWWPRGHRTTTATINRQSCTVPLELQLTQLDQTFMPLSNLAALAGGVLGAWRGCIAAFAHPLCFFSPNQACLRIIEHYKTFWGVSRLGSVSSWVVKAIKKQTKGIHYLFAELVQVGTFLERCPKPPVEQDLLRSSKAFTEHERSPPLDAGAGARILQAGGCFVHIFHQCVKCIALVSAALEVLYFTADVGVCLGRQRHALKEPQTNACSGWEQ